jgi:acetoin:2,6-dichlorophenolindophenol oxidoreductase subunit alpha
MRRATDRSAVTIVDEVTRLPDEDVERLVRIRVFERNVLELFSRGELHGTTHTCLGQEYVPVALRPLLHDDDFVFSNHRGHGHYLARFDDVDGLLSEILGREGAVCRGVGGSQHLYRNRSYLSTGVQGESVPVAAGVAFHFKRYGSRELAVVHIGDGTWGQGAVYEALNLASLWKLPLLVVVENNAIAQSTPIALQLAGSIEGRARAFDIDYERVTTTDVARIRRSLGSAIERARERRLPLIVEFETIRLGPHSKGDDTRSAEQLETLRERDFLAHYAARFADQYDAAVAVVEAEIAGIVRDVLSRPLARWEPS